MSTRIKNVSPKVYNGTTYRSTLEAETAKSLDLLGIPFKYESSKIMLLEGFYSKFQKRKVEQITYTPDFEVGNIIIECKGYETPEWKLKKKLVFKYLEKNEPNKVFYQIYDSKRSLIRALDKHWTEMGYSIKVTSVKINKRTHTPVFEKIFPSIEEAFDELNLTGRSETGVFNALAHLKDRAYQYKWELVKIFL